MPCLEEHSKFVESISPYLFEEFLQFVLLCEHVSTPFSLWLKDVENPIFVIQFLGDRVYNGEFVVVFRKIPFPRVKAENQPSDLGFLQRIPSEVGIYRQI